MPWARKNCSSRIRESGRMMPPKQRYRKFTSLFIWIRSRRSELLGQRSESGKRAIFEICFGEWKGFGAEVRITKSEISARIWIAFPCTAEGCFFQSRHFWNEKERLLCKIHSSRCTETLERAAAAASAAAFANAGRVGTCRIGKGAKENGRQVPPAGVYNVFFGTRKFNSSSFFWQ